MRYLLIICLLFGNHCYGQQYILSEKLDEGSDNQKYTEIRVELQKVKSLNENRDLMQLKVAGVEYREGTSSKDKIFFSSSDPNKNKNALGTNLMLHYFYLLEHPVLFEVERGKIYLDSVKLSKEILNQIEFWELKENVKSIASQGIFSEIEGLAKRLYLPLPKEIKLEKIDSWKDTLNGFSYTVIQRDKKTINLKTKGEEGNYYGSLKINDQLQVLEKELIHDFEFTYNGEPTSKGTNVRKIFTTASFNDSRVDSAYLNMLVLGSNLSNACFVKNSIDNNRFFDYLNRYELKFSNDKMFVKYKLNGLMFLNNFPRYEIELQKVPANLLAGTPHLLNKANNPDLSMNEFLEIISLFDQEELYDHLQSGLSQSFLNDEEYQLNKLTALASHQSDMISNAAKPMFYWVNARRNSGNTDSLKFYAEKLLQSNDAEWNSGNSGRYALLIYKMFKGDPAAAYASDYLSRIIVRLKSLYEDSKNDKRQVQQAHLAYAYYLNYDAINHLDPELARQMLKQAVFYSSKEQNSTYTILIDRHFLGSKENYQEDYLNLLASEGKTDLALKEYVEGFLNNPDKTFDGLKSFYVKNYGAENFSRFFKNDVLTRLEDAPAFELLNLLGKNYSLKDGKGKWLVIDFWGTWCVPCIVEMPGNNKFYTELKKEKDSKIEFITIACRDTQEKVENFLEANGYSFPVLMSDNEVEHIYKVPGFPTKVIISPEGKLLRVSLGFDWKTLVKELASL